MVLVVNSTWFNVREVVGWKWSVRFGLVWFGLMEACLGVYYTSDR